MTRSVRGNAQNAYGAARWRAARQRVNGAAASRVSAPHGRGVDQRRCAAPRRVCQRAFATARLKHFLDASRACARYYLRVAVFIFVLLWKRMTTPCVLSPRSWARRAPLFSPHS